MQFNLSPTIYHLSFKAPIVVVAEPVSQPAAVAQSKIQAAEQHSQTANITLNPQTLPAVATFAMPQNVLMPQQQSYQDYQQQQQQQMQLHQQHQHQQQGVSMPGNFGPSSSSSGGVSAMPPIYAAYPTNAPYPPLPVVMYSTTSQLGVPGVVAMQQNASALANPPSYNWTVGNQASFPKQAPYNPNYSTWKCGVQQNGFPGPRTSLWRTQLVCEFVISNKLIPAPETMVCE